MKSYITVGQLGLAGRNSAMMLTEANSVDSCLLERVRTMPLGLLGLKVGMTQVYDTDGKIAPVTVLQVGPCPVLLVRDQKRDGYDAVQVGFLNKERRKATRPERGHVSADLPHRLSQVERYHGDGNEEHDG